MGEFAIDTRTGRRIKLGCQYHMEYISYEKMKAALPYLKRDPQCGFPEDYFKEPMSTYWRFPFPDEKDAPISEINDLEFWRKESFKITHKGAIELVNWVEKKVEHYILSIGFQKEHDGYLIPVFEITEHPTHYSINGKESISGLTDVIMDGAVRFKYDEKKLKETEQFCEQLIYYSQTPISELIKPEKLNQIIV